MAELLYTTRDFSPLGQPTAGVPMLLDGEMKLIEPACAWLLHIALVRGRSRSPETWRTYAEALFDWWQTLEANGWLWDDIGPDELAAYRNGMLEGGSQITGRAFARSTINARLRTVSRFYRWCEAVKLIDKAPVLTGLGPSRGRTFLAHVDARGGRGSINDLTLRTGRRLPRPAELEAVRTILRSMGQRDRLIAEWALTTGMRRMEIANLRLAELPAQSMTAGAALIPVGLSTTKGGKPRQVYPPLPLIDRTWSYVREERAVAIERARRRGRTSGDRVFLTSRATAMSPRRVGSVFYEAARKIGDPVTFHRLRHLFAATMLSILQRVAVGRSDIKPLLALQTLLGHESIETTMIYLDVIAADIAHIDVTMDDLFRDLF
jgi:integrase